MLENQPNKEQEIMAERWRKILPPIRPSKKMVELYEKNILTAIQNKSNPIWGLLGCTPEIRSIAGKYNAQITCIDRDCNAYHAYKTLSNISRYEKFVCSNWLDLELREEFDIVIGDGAMAMLPIEDHAKLITNVHKMIKPGGFASLRIQSVSPLVFNTPEKIFEWYRKEKPNEPVYFATRAFLYALWLNPPHKLRLTNDEFFTNVQELYRKGIITDKEFEGLKDIKKSVVTIQYITREILDKLIFSLFEIESVDYAGDYLIHHDHPIYLLKKI